MTLTPEQLKILSGITLNTDSEIKNTSTPFTEEQLKVLDEVSLEAPTINAEKNQDEPSVAADLARVFVDSASSLAELPLRLASMGSEALGFNKIPEEYYDQSRKMSLEMLTSPLRVLGADETADKLVSSVLTEKGKPKKTETTIGAVGEVGAYIVGASKIAKADKLKNLSLFKRSVIGGAGINQILSDVDDENLFNVVQQTLPENLQNDFVDFMSSKKDDTELERRLKLVGEEMTIGLIGEIIGSTSKVAYRSFKQFDKNPKDLTKEERGSLLIGYLKQAKEKISTKNNYFEEAEFTTSLKQPRQTGIVYEEAPEAFKQVAQQNGAGMSGILKRMTGQFFTSRGYWSKRAYNAFEDSLYAQRQAVTKAEKTANRLQKHLDAIVETKEGPQIIKTVNKIFEDQIDFTFTKGLNFEDQVTDVANEFNLPKNIATELVKARNQIDQLSKDLIGSPDVPDDFKEAIVEGMGSYLRRSYRLYEDVGYKPSDDVTEKAREFLTKQFQQKNPNLSESFAIQEADIYLQKILDSGSTKETNQYLSRVNRVNDEILKGRKDIPKELRAFMGEIKEPSENIILTVSKMSKLSENSRFFATFKQLGESGGYVHKAPTIINGKEFNQVIQGTNSTLDGSYTSKEMLKAIQEKQGQITGLRQFDGYKKFLKVQGTIQKFKTVYSHMTHMKNLAGGAIMSASNGVNPFGKNTKSIFDNLRNSIVEGGDVALDESYDKLLRLGVINTNATVNEYRELLEVGYRANATDGFKWIENTMPYGTKINKGVKKGQKVLKGVEDVYVATDDFFKINTYLTELDTLKRANTGKPLEVLEAEAARIAQNTYANYDRVPYGIKALKDLPIGSFVSFPAESIRTRINILRQGAKEIASENPVLKARGQQRLSAMAVSQSALVGAGYGSAKLVFGNDDEKIKAANILSEKPWSKVGTRMWGQDGDTGDIFYWDTSSHDPFDATNEPAALIINEILSENLKGEALDKRLLSLSVNLSSSVVEPFISSTILADVARDVIHAVGDPAGRTAKGKEMFPKGLPISERLGNVAYHILDKTMPGSLTAGVDLINVMNEKPNRITGKTKSLRLEGAKNLSSINIEKLDVEDAMLFSVIDYNKNKNTVLSAYPDYEKTGGELANRMRLRNKQLYKIEQELYRKVNASITLTDEATTTKYLLDAGLSKQKTKEIIAGIFMPEKPSKDKLIEIYQKSPRKVPEEFKETLETIMFDYRSMVGVSLIIPENKDPVKIQRMQRIQKATGGKVSSIIPNAPVEPDERINKLTGIPYNEEAGTAYMDEDDPMRVLSMAAGGRVKKDLGGLIAKAIGMKSEDIEWAKSIDKSYEKNEAFDGKGDAARHLALGWAASRSENPDISLKTINAREYVTFDGVGREMDMHNNNLGFKIQVNSQAEAQKEIDKLIKNKKAKYMTLQESKKLRGYAKGGKVLKQLKRNCA